TLGDEKVDYGDPKAKRDRLFGKYFHQVQPALSGRTVEVSVHDVARDLRAKADWIFRHLSGQEKIQVKEAGRTYTWFNGYYDNQGRRVEGFIDKKVRMTLTGQVFAVMSGLAADDDVAKIIASVDRFLKDKELGGLRLNTDFGLDNYMDLGRAFGFAYGTKENGAFFSHMNVMYAAALYQRGFARPAFEVVQSMYRMAVDGKVSKIYPGIPEYFDGEGRGMYHYLTGSASWLVLTQLTQVFGVRGRRGDLVLAPRLVKEEFDKKGTASVTCQFAGKRLTVEYHNPQRLDAGRYAIKQISINGQPAAFTAANGQALLPRETFTRSAIIKVRLG
ncbi:MAG: cellobiose phosphorylase, partial [Candidatus Omnitrophica bacterium]|nr:cellobiose phosphorylase [Candidatus Omnitrophota bacterium]